MWGAPVLYSTDPAADTVVREWDPDAPADDYFGDRSQMDDLASRYGVQPAELEDHIRLTASGLK